jgi:hypothetical protein
MGKISKFIRKNLLGIAVTLGVCSFIYEGLIIRSYSFSITIYAGALVILVAVYTRYKDNLAFHLKKNQKVSGKDE